MRRVEREADVRKLLTADPRTTLPDAVFQAVARQGALLEGHFQLQSGDHSRYFLRFSEIGWDRNGTRELARLLLGRSAEDIAGSVVLCSAAAGVFFAAAVRDAAHDTRLVVTDVDERRRPIPTLRLGELQRGDRVVIVADVVTRGNTLRKLLAVSKQREATTTAVLTFATLRPADLVELLKTEGLRGDWLLESAPAWETFAPKICPMCRRGEDELLHAFEFA